MGAAKRVNTIGTNSDQYVDWQYKPNREEIDAEQAKVANRQAPMVGAAAAGTTSISRVEDREMRDQQQKAIDQFALAAKGQGPSIAGTQLQAGTEAALAAQMAGAASARGNVSPALAMRQYGNTAAQMQQGAALQAAQIKAQEAQAAQQAWAQALAGTRAQDAAIAQQQAQLNQQTALANAGFAQQSALANQQASLGMTGMNDAAMRSLLGMQLQQDENNRQALMGFARDYSGEQIGSVVPSQEKAMDRTARGIGAIGSAFTGFMK